MPLSSQRGPGVPPVASRGLALLSGGSGRNPPMLSVALVVATTLLAPPPRLVVILAIDQFRTDYLTRFQDLYIPTGDETGGFRYLMEYGAWFVNAEYNHVPTETGPGHATIGTGAPPGIHGIVANSWWADGKSVYCVDDPDAKDVLTGAASASPRNLLVSTLTDEVERATGGKSYSLSVALKDRAAILMAGRSADMVFWFNSSRLAWTTSTYYAKDGRLPDWVAGFNERVPAMIRDVRTWEQSLPEAAYVRTRPTVAPGAGESFGTTFPHTVRSYSDWRMTPYANQLTLELAKAGILAYGMGYDDIPDVVTISLSANDYLGHAFGPDSPEMLEMCVRTDEAIRDFLVFLDREVRGGLSSVALAFTSDHGVCNVPEDEAARGFPMRRVSPRTVQQFVEDALQQKYGRKDFLASFDEAGVYLNQGALVQAKQDARAVGRFIRDTLLQHPDVIAAYYMPEVAEGYLDDSPLTQRLRRSYRKGRSPDVYYILPPGFYPSAYPGGTGHGSPWSYDSRVPVIFIGPWFRPGRSTEPCTPEDIAPTLCDLAGAARPTGATGRAIGLAVR